MTAAPRAQQSRNEATCGVVSRTGAPRQRSRIGCVGEGVDGKGRPTARKKEDPERRPPGCDSGSVATGMMEQNPLEKGKCWLEVVIK